MSIESLTKTFADLADEVLLERYRSGSLTEEAMSVAEAEIRHRGLECISPAPETDEAPQPGADEDLVAVARGLPPLEAQMLRGRLEAEGIFAFVANAHLMNALPIWTHAVHGGARVLVRRARLAEARAILAAQAQGDFLVDEEP